MRAPEFGEHLELGQRKWKSGSTDPFLLLDPERTQPSLLSAPHSGPSEGGNCAKAARHLDSLEGILVSSGNARGVPPSASSFPRCSHVTLATATALVLTAVKSISSLVLPSQLRPHIPSSRWPFDTPCFLRLGILSKCRPSSYFQRRISYQTNSQDPGNRVSQGQAGKLR